jgi:D-sedoheptulose 7-phosphate isomerase
MIFIFGNGGSASTSSHFCCDLNKGVSYGKHKKFHAHSLTDNMATITAYANDTSYDDVFVEPLKNFLNPGDLVIAISGSGNSKNVIKAVEYANSMGNRTAGITGYNGGKLKQIATLSVNANVNDMEISEDIHMILCHTIKNVFMDLLKDEK